MKDKGEQKLLCLILDYTELWLWDNMWGSIKAKWVVVHPGVNVSSCARLLFSVLQW